jgi:hypothetical protein
MTNQELTEAKFAVLDRMIEAGWATEVARTGDAASASFTPRGREIITEIQRLFLTGGEMDGAEIVAFCKIVRELQDPS